MIGPTMPRSKRDSVWFYEEKQALVAMTMGIPNGMLHVTADYDDTPPGQEERAHVEMSISQLRAWCAQTLSLLDRMENEGVF